MFANPTPWRWHLDIPDESGPIRLTQREHPCVGFASAKIQHLCELCKKKRSFRSFLFENFANYVSYTNTPASIGFGGICVFVVRVASGDDGGCNQSPAPCFGMSRAVKRDGLLGYVAAIVQGLCPP